MDDDLGLVYAKTSGDYSGFNISNYQISEKCF